jgi:hypothetical protein
MVKLQKGTFQEYRVVTLGPDIKVEFVEAKPANIAAAINAGYPKIRFGPVSESIARRHRNEIATEQGSGTEWTHPDTIGFFCNSPCDIEGIKGLAAHIEAFWCDFYSAKPNNLIMQAKRFVKMNNFPKVRLFGRWLFCANSVDWYMIQHLKNRY